jgi:hypothetical protein
MITAGFEQTRGFLGNPHKLMIGTIPVPAGGTVFVGTGMGTTKYTQGLPMSCLSDNASNNDTMFTCLSTLLQKRKIKINMSE